MFMGIVAKYKSINVYAGDLESDVLLQRLTYSPNCLAYYNQDFGRAYLNTVDWAKATNETLDKCFNQSYYLTIKIINLETGESKFISTTTFPGGTLNRFIKPVMIYNNTRVYNGKLEVAAQI
jgi:hypothetical protein